MRATLVRVIEDEHVTRLEGEILDLSFIDHRFHRKGHDTHKDRQARLSLDQGLARFRVVESVARVMGFSDDRIESASE